MKTAQIIGVVCFAGCVALMGLAIAGTVACPPIAIPIVASIAIVGMSVAAAVNMSEATYGVRKAQSPTKQMATRSLRSERKDIEKIKSL